MENKIELKSCPFCGEKEDIWLCNRFYKGPIKSLVDKLYWYIECQGCEVRTANYWESDFWLEELQKYYNSARDVVVYMWNKRK